jgi:hypothetical protein
LGAIKGGLQIVGRWAVFEASVKTTCLRQRQMLP